MSLQNKLVLVRGEVIPVEPGFIDKTNQVVAAGPLHVLDCGVLSDMYVRAVIVFKIGVFYTAVEELDHDGIHLNFDTMTACANPKEAGVRFGELVNNLNGHPYYQC